MLSTILDKLGVLRQNKQESAIALYKQLVRSIAAKRPIEPERASAILDAVGKSCTELAADVARVESRAADAALVATHEATLTEMRQATRELDGENIAFAKHREEHHERTKRFTAVIDASRKKLNAIDAAKDRLRSTAAEEIQQERRAVAQARTSQSGIVERMKAENAELRTNLQPLQQRLKQFEEEKRLSSKEAKEVQRKADDLATQLSESTSRLEKAIAAQKQLDADHDRIRAQMLVA